MENYQKSIIYNNMNYSFVIEKLYWKNPSPQAYKQGESFARNSLPIPMNSTKKHLTTDVFLQNNEINPYCFVLA